MVTRLLISLSVVLFTLHPAWGVPNAVERDTPGDGWESYPFEPLNLIDEMASRDFAGASLIADAELFNRIQRKEFEVLELSHLHVRPESAVVSNDAEGNLSWISVPFAMTLRYTRRTSSVLSPFHGTLECAGEIRIYQNDSHVEVSVTRFEDSTPFEWLARKLGLSKDINLQFARAVMEPVLTAHFNAHHEPVEVLLGMLNQGR